MVKHGAILLAAAGLAMAGCVDKGSSKPQKKIDPAYIQAHLLSEVPTIANQVNADFEGKVVYLGNNVSTDTLAPGGKITIDHYWRVVQPPGHEWRIFAHVQGDAKSDWMNVDYTDMRVGYPASKWRAGDIIHDEQKFALANNWVSKYADVLVGLYPKGKHAITDRMLPKGGVVDDQRRVLAVKLTVDAGGAKAPKVDVIRRVEEPITIDGLATEEAWKKAPESPDFTIAEGSPQSDLATTAKLLWDDDYLYVFVHAEDRDIASQYQKNDDPMWKEDVIELFIDADKSGKGYVELQVNPHNAQFDSWFPQTRKQKFHQEWSAGMKTAVKLYGTLNQRDDTDQAWDAEIAIPWAAVKGMDEAMAVTLPPAVGDSWNLNIVRGEKPKKGGLIASSWNQITYSDFHALDRMLTITFGDANGVVEAAAEPADPAGPAGGGSAPETPAEAPTTGAATPAKPAPGAAEPASPANKPAATPPASLEKKQPAPTSP